MKDWETQFRTWSKPPTDSEEARISNAETAIKEALKASGALKNRGIRIFTQGSLRNNTNVRKESDVDIAVVCEDVFFPDYPEGTTQETFGNRNGDYNYKDFKNDVQSALVAKFGAASVHRGNKAFDIAKNRYGVEADVAPFFEHRHYSKNGDYLKGVELRPDNCNPHKVINWPEQHYNNGVSKNNTTGKRYKALVRVFKCLRNEMENKQIQEATPIPGFLIECLIWNVPNGKFSNLNYMDDVRACIYHLWDKTRSDEGCSEWGEVSELKNLFRSNQKWTRQQANSFLERAWNYIGFK
jgi:hypothetical protein